MVLRNHQHQRVLAGEVTRTHRRLDRRHALRALAATGNASTRREARPKASDEKRSFGQRFGQLKDDIERDLDQARHGWDERWSASISK